jgi:hypothetical protein
MPCYSGYLAFGQNRAGAALDVHESSLRRFSNRLTASRTIDWAITGQKPAKLANFSVSNKPPTMQETAPPLIAGGGEAQSDYVACDTRLFPHLI